MGWQLFAAGTYANWCGHGQEIIPFPLPDDCVTFMPGMGGRDESAALVSTICGCTIRTGVRTIRTFAWVRAAFLGAGAAACLVGCITAAPIPPTYTQDELKAICERNGGRWYPDDLVGGFCGRR